MAPTCYVKANRDTRLASASAPVVASETTISQGTAVSSFAPLVGPLANSVPSVPTTAKSQDESIVAQAAPSATAPSFLNTCTQTEQSTTKGTSLLFAYLNPRTAGTCNFYYVFNNCR